MADRMGDVGLLYAANFDVIFIEMSRYRPRRPPTTFPKVNVDAVSEYERPGGL
jgi:hypothetical protein